MKQRFLMKSLFLAATSCFAIGTVLGMLAPHFWILIGGRLLQGLGTGIALPLMFNIVLEQVPLHRLGVVMGIASLTCALAPAVGPSLGGMLVQKWGWRSIFAVLLPLVLVAGAMGAASIRQSSVLCQLPFAWRSYLLLGICFCMFIFALSFSGEYGVASLIVIGLLMGAFLFLALFCYVDGQAAAPLIHLHVFSFRPFDFSVISLLLVQFICLGQGFLIPNYTQISLGIDPMTAGCILLPGCIIGAILSPFSGQLLDRYGARLPMLCGFFCVIVSTALFAAFFDVATIGGLVSFYVFFAFGQGLSIGTTQTSGLQGLPGELRADGNAVFTTLQQLAGAAGTAVVSTIVASYQIGAHDLATATTRGSQVSFNFLLLLAMLLFYSGYKAVKRK